MQYNPFKVLRKRLDALENKKRSAEYSLVGYSLRISS